MIEQMFYLVKLPVCGGAHVTTTSEPFTGHTRALLRRYVRRGAQQRHNPAASGPCFVVTCGGAQKGQRLRACGDQAGCASAVAWLRSTTTTIAGTTSSAAEMSPSVA